VVTETQPSFSLVGSPYLEYMPVVDLSTGRVLGMEALVRWQHPTHGLISPARLLPHAEVSGDIGPLTRWILREACLQARRWSSSIQLGVNCTIHQLRRGEVSTAVELALEETGFPAGQMTLEVTEDAIADSAAGSDIKTLSTMGVQLSVDDVGTNWSSFEPFKRSSISTVKIDGSFIAGLESTQGINRLVVETVIHMAHSLGMSAIVEWVETPAQVEIVRSFNADAAQGFFFSLPLSSEEAVVLAQGPDVPQFSRREQRTLLSSPADGGSPPGGTRYAPDSEPSGDGDDGGTVNGSDPTSADGSAFDGTTSGSVEEQVSVDPAPAEVPAAAGAPMDPATHSSPDAA
jgi:EAL domain-containing protein (putative c-di-GMP-specific phosphodiesterase class I)